MTTGPDWRNKAQWLEEFGAVTGVPHPAVHMGLALWQRASSKPPFTCWPSVASLAAYVGVSETRAHELLQALRLAQWVTVHRRAGGRRLTNMYELTRGATVWPPTATVQRRPSRQPPRRSSDEPEVADLFRSPDEPVVEHPRRPPVEGARRPPVEGIAPAVPTSRSTEGEPRNLSENLEDAAAASRANRSSVPGLERVAVSRHRHSADARDADDADATRQLEDETPANTTSAADVGRLVSELARNARLP